MEYDGGQDQEPRRKHFEREAFFGLGVRSKESAEISKE